MIYIRPEIVTISIFYYRPDATYLVNEFVWQTFDIVPEYPRIRKFLDHWRTDVQARIQEIYLLHSFDNDWVRANFSGTIQ